MSQYHQIAIVGTAEENDQINQLTAQLSALNEPYRCYAVDEWNAVPPSEHLLTLLLTSNVVTDHGASIITNLPRLSSSIPLILLQTCQPNQALDPHFSARHITTIEPNTPQLKLLESLYLCQIAQEQFRGNDNPFRKRALCRFRSLVGADKDMQHARDTAETAATHDNNVLIKGPLGSAKEVIARNIHYHSSRREQPFVSLNCQAVPSALLATELFGEHDSPGRLQQAHQGTFFIDDIEHMPKDMQETLLKVLQAGDLSFAGTGCNTTIDVRIISGTQVDLAANAQAQSFSEVLCALLHNEPIELPPLKSRVQDLFILTSEIIARIKALRLPAMKKFSPSAMEALRKYDWPGNERELANLVDHMSHAYPNAVIDISQLPTRIAHK